MKAVITGGLGHIGSRLIRELPIVFPSMAVVIVDNLATQRYVSLFNLPSTVKYYFVQGDVTQIDLAPVFAGADVVIHLAALTDPGASFDHPEAMEQINYAATQRVAEACVEAGVPLIHASSTSVYGTEKDSVDEFCGPEDISPQSPYAEIKHKEELFVKDLCHSGSLRGMSFRFGTIFGISPGMRFHTAVNKFCWQAAMGQPLSVWNTAYDQMRPYLDLGDAVRAIQFVIQHQLFDGGIYNAVSINISVRDVVDTIGRYIPNLKIELVDSRIMNTLSYRVLNTRLTRHGFLFQGGLDEAVRTTLQQLRNANSVCV
ncbi:NAD(P)-dependent oxidoreductase [Polynucleobacter sp. MWH-Braz-FAM2G]|uniref:NAD-dependent epimerase/dehydratase family protein n=1 Tax=Polynucleobacter sp. MWH-Braz-FAM2G TaxID=1855883 RepID=UPI001BFDE5EC|nr:SDR family oxidoreductase [Polynucleobacter sp. MWH-Braz-FAM2G]QWD91093.1 SDR family oxidoreductase [Polynucleobacter sp. MWH-Braz-FAM2G]